MRTIISVFRPRSQVLLLGLIQLSLTFMLGTLIGSADSATADTCTDCQTQKRVSCSTKCDSAPDRLQYDKCVKECVVPACATKCAKTPGENRPSLEVSEESCRACLGQQLAGGCLDKCDRLSPTYDRCRKTCAKQKCSRQCALPDAGFDNRPPRPKYACQQCKMNAEMTCRGNMACGQGEPGSVACQFHCVAKSCEKICDEEAADQEE